MKWIKRDKMILDNDIGNLVAILPDSNDELRDAVITLAPEALEIIISFVEATKNGSLKAKSTFDKMERLLEKIPNYVLDDERVQIQ